ncbi:MAG: BCD family MFS transporter [Candidatus Promineifilaceae bacterium]
MAAKEAANRYRPGRILRLSSFQIGSAMGDILVTSIWNRVMIANFGIPAAPVSLLIALRYLISPISLWAGYRSDNRPFLGFQRTSYIWLGRALMIAALPILGFSLMRFEAYGSDAIGWALALASSLLYGLGTLISGSPYLALVRDSVPPEKQGLAISTVETVLIICFAIAGIVFGTWMEVYEQRLFWELVLATMLIGGFFWFFSIVGIEKRSSADASHGAQALSAGNFLVTMGKIWGDPRTRGFFFFLALATLSAWMQDAILEPFGADVFSFSAGRTTRFNSYWQAATVVTLIISMLFWRKRPPERQGKVATSGLLVMALGLVLLAFGSMSGRQSLVEPSLLLFGAGFGVYTFGGLSLMAVMSADQNAGAYLGLWTVAILVFKGLGTFLGGALRDILFLRIGLPPAASYGLVFLTAAAGILLSVFLLSRVDIAGFARDYGRVLGYEDVQAATAG